MNWFLWTYLVMAILDGLGKIVSIGEPREPRSRGLVMFDLFMNGLITWGVIYYGMRP